ncbi:MAG: hypothetical protein VX438_15770, partial [Planctomycetota bacterium]|nr:hypothetical protein [Planctomycetota bacterium]
NTTVVGGSQHETRFPMLSIESVIDEFARGKSCYQKICSKGVDFFGRRRYGLMTSLPQILEHFGFKGAFHFTLDDGRFPEGMQIKSFWEGDGEAQIEVFGKVPLDANAAGHFLNLGVKIGESFDMDHAAAICFVHWPGKTSIWYEDLRRICKYGSVLGKFVSTAQFLEEMEEPYQHDRFNHDQYQSPYFKQAIMARQRNPVSKSMDYWRRSLTYDSIRSLEFLTAIFKEKPVEKLSVSRSEIIQEFESKETDSSPLLDERLSNLEQQAAKRLVDSLGGEVGHGSQDGSTVVINTDSLVQRSSIFVSGVQPPAVEKPIYASSEISTLPVDRGHVVVDVPAMGYDTVYRGKTTAPAAETMSPPPVNHRSPLVVDEHALRNEFLEVMLDPVTGGIRAVHDYKTRGNRLSQVLALRSKTKENDRRFQYSSMMLDSLETIHNSTSFGLVKATGHLVNDGKRIAEFTQEFSLSRGSRAVVVDVEFRNLEAPTGDPWNCYVGSRFAFKDEGSLVSTTLNQSRQAVMGNRIEAAHYIDLETLKSRTSILTAGVPFHVRRGDRYLDSIYVVKGESCRRFRFGIGVDLTNPLFQACHLIKSPATVETDRKLSPDCSWLFHFDSKNVVATSWEPVMEQSTPVGFRARILETMGRESKFRLSAFKWISQAKKIRFNGESVGEIPVENGKIVLHLNANQLIEIEARW